MYVKDSMTVNPVTISADLTITRVLDLMNQNNFHRLPVVDDRGHLIGLITEGVIEKNSPSQATSLSIHEINYLLSKTKVKDIMIKKVFTITPDELLEKAAVLMRKKEIGCLPVVSGERLVGIITQNDIFDAFVDLLGYHEEATRVVIEIEQDKPGILKQISTVLSKQKINITRLTVRKQKDIIYMYVQVQKSDGEIVKALIEESGYKVVSVIQLPQANGE
ncbi:MAG: CBS domain-containing protein [Erysipelotrichaceae bacterium]|jgi:acetoin utilization protein AcuB|nr:CBS domain-containing protein [Erysipelotrichaceae bacterium]